MTSSNQTKHESKNPVQRRLIRRFHTAAIAMLRRTGARTILDLGCGEGFVLAEIANHNLGAELTGIDRSPHAVLSARSRLGSRAQIDQADARDLLEGGRRYDCVMMLEVLEHIPDPAAMLPILERLTTSHLLLSVPREPYFCAINLLRGKNVRCWGNDIDHVNHWSQNSFRRFAELRFDIIEMPAVFPWTMILAKKK